MAEAPIFVILDPAQDVADIIAAYESLAGVTLSPSAVEHLILKALAYRVSLVKTQVQDAATQNLVDFARAPSLDYLAAYVGVTRLAASPALVTIEFTLVLNVSGITIPQGTRIASIDGLAVFVLTADLDLPATVLTGSAIAECTATGEAANGYTPGQVTDIQDPFPYVISATNTDTSAGGADSEEDDALRRRVKAAPAAFSVAGSRKAYIFHALTASELLVDVAVPDTLGDGVVNIYPLMRDGSTTPSLILAAVEEACSAETVRPLSDTVVAIAPTAVNYSITVQLTVYTTADQAEVIAAVEEAIDALALAKRQLMGQDIVRTQFTQAIHNAHSGVFLVTFVGFPTPVVTVAETEYGYMTARSVSVTATTNG